MENKNYDHSKILPYLKAVPDIPRSKNFYGKGYTSKCPCGGTITAFRGKYNGHIHAKCDSCNFQLHE